jgi:hypothetical protein
MIFKNQKMLLRICGASAPVVKTPAAGQPFDHGVFELVE